MATSFLRDDDLSPAAQAEVLELAAAMKADPFARKPYAGPQAVAMIFDKPTLRTQVSFGAGIAHLGGYPLLVDGSMAQIGTRESVDDVARVLGRQVSAIVWRTFHQSDLEQMAHASGVPVINALTDDFHPCQVLADLLTITEHRGSLAGQQVAYVGDVANNMTNSYLLGCATAGMSIRVAGPAGNPPDEDIVATAEKIAAQTGGEVRVEVDPAVAVAGADVVITDTWVSMGQEQQAAERKGEASPFLPYQLNAELLAGARDDAIVLHCLPAYRGFEITAEVIDGRQSVVWDEAENRLHAQKAILAYLKQ